jgi:TonB family protein
VVTGPVSKRVQDGSADSSMLTTGGEEGAMSERFELGRTGPAPRGGSQLLSLAVHALVGALLIAAPALTPAALPEVRLRSEPIALPMPRVELASVRSTPLGHPPAGSGAAPALPADTSAPPPPRLSATLSLGALASRIIGAGDMASEGPAWGGSSEGVAGGMPGGLPAAAAGGAGGDRPREIGGKVRRPVLLSAPAPRYPELARRVGLQGEVVVECVIDREGAVRDARVVRGSPLLRQAALDAVSRWRYAPTLLNGEPVAVRLEVSVRFVLR